MASRNKITEFVQQQVRHRSKNLCEYCHASEQWQYVKFTVDHVLPISLGGTNSLDNLALACFHCNRRKTNRLTAIDPESGETVSLFNPRQDSWREHFVWSADKCQVLGLTATGRATIAVLNLNRERIIHIRAADLEVERHPPVDDPVIE
ncbi:MAG: HNH endonuclease [Cyanobacteria bacterium CRU_2_1]|nr:HNH endonuclease [Cyanobacteria bacterium RU_5_0]NJR60368.1 HNH endonuclease [Cyanobacteria bacterium CRU_2_1]